jgi:hypothetical protein
MRIQGLVGRWLSSLGTVGFPLEWPEKRESFSQNSSTAERKIRFSVWGNFGTDYCPSDKLFRRMKVGGRISIKKVWHFCQTL